MEILDEDPNDAHLLIRRDEKRRADARSKNAYFLDTLGLETENDQANVIFDPETRLRFNIVSGDDQRDFDPINVDVRRAKPGSVEVLLQKLEDDVMFVRCLGLTFARGKNAHGLLGVGNSPHVYKFTSLDMPINVLSRVTSVEDHNTYTKVVTDFAAYVCGRNYSETTGKKHIEHEEDVIWSPAVLPETIDHAAFWER